jgi:hypothetical protein
MPVEEVSKRKVNWVRDWELQH